MDPHQLRGQRVMRRLRECEGYLELGLPQKALERLDSIGDVGEWRGVIEMLRGRICLVMGDLPKAAEAFRAAAEHSQAPHDRLAWGSLSHVYRLCGEPLLAIQTLGRARGAFAKPYHGPHGTGWPYTHDLGTGSGDVGSAS
ncbi:MAG: hypothetical protein D6741_19225 [Planctomycetota bacterium]|nr:MAG: hypothetical protein D6741_19225 [Planctomycetota bacterium]